MLAVLLAPALAFAPSSPLRDVTIAEVLPRVYYLKFPTRRLLAGTFMRVQESYESPRYRGKVFTAKEFLAWYETTLKGKKDSYFDWDGFNVPSTAFAPFFAGKFDPLSPEEAALVAFARGLKGDFYLIGTAGKDSGPETLGHELAHARWATEPAYRKAAETLLDGADMKAVFAFLRAEGYHEAVWRDEAQAWLGDPEPALREEGLDPVPYRALSAKLRALQRR